MFSGNIVNSTKSNHVFIINEEVFQNYGSTTFSRKGWTEFLATDFGIKVAKEYYGGNVAKTMSIFTTLALTTAMGEYHKFDGTTYSKTSISTTEIDSLLDYHERSDRSTKNEEKEKQIIEINGSLEGCIVFKKTATTTTLAPNPNDPDPDPNTTTTTTTQSPKYAALKLYFYTQERRNDRIVTQKGAPMITEVPRRPTLGKYGLGYTKENLKDATGVGTFSDASKEGTDDIKNLVTAPLRMNFNEALGCWDTQNQILATLITDVDAADVKAINYESFLSSAQSSDFYKTDSENYIGARKVGAAIPLSVQNNNPSMFGPNLLKCNTDNKLEQIKVVNRSNQEFKKGEIVLCTLMGAEWIIQKFSDGAASPSKTKPGRWGFYKFITNSDWFFRTNFDSENKGGDTILPAQCQQMLRHKFYNSLSSATSNIPTVIADKVAIASLNQVAPTPVYNLHTYIQVSSFDMSGPAKKGTADQDFYYNTNMYNPPQDGEKIFWNTPLYWGPIFPDGYATAGYYAMSNDSSNIIPYAESGVSGRAYFSNASTNGLDFFGSTNATPSGISTLYTNDRNFYQLPADIATNGRYSDKSFPLEASEIWIGAINSSNFANRINDCIQGGVGLFLSTAVDPATNNQDVYALTPINPLRLQFSPLCAELVGADDIKSPDAKNPDRKFQQLARDLLNAKKPASAATIPNTTKLFKGVYNRLKNYSRSNLITVTAVACSAYNGAFGFTFDCIPYDCYIKYKPLNKPRAATDIFSDYNDPDKTGSNTVGIIVARNKITKSKGGTLNISADQRFGITGKPIGGTGMDNPFFSAIGGLLNLTTGGGQTLAQKWYAAWGSTINDAINSFGTTALYGMVWDYWPEKQTVFIPQYFTVLHFNPGPLLSVARKKDDIDQIDYDVDFRIPTSSGQALSRLAGVTKDSIVDKPSEWKVNTIRRGQLVTGEGFFYRKTLIGLTSYGATIEDPGEGFSPDNEINISKNAVLSVNTVNSSGGIVSYTFAEDKTLKNAGFNLNLLLSENLKQGEGVMPSDFQPSGYLVSVPSPTPNKRDAKIRFTTGVVYTQIKRDVGPQLRCPITKLSASSSEGRVPIEITTNTTMDIEDNTGSKYPGQYELFLFYQNDVGLVYHTNSLENIPDFAQHITIDIS
jgi:hypothetical protein